MNLLSRVRLGFQPFRPQRGASAELRAGLLVRLRPVGGGGCAGGLAMVVSPEGAVCGVFTSGVDAHLVAKAADGVVWLCAANSDKAVRVERRVISTKVEQK